MRDVTPEEDDADDVSPDIAAAGKTETAEPQQETARSTAHPANAASATDAPSDDPTDSAVRRVRRLFGIRDRRRHWAGDPRRAQNGTTARAGQTAKTANGRAEHDASSTEAETGAEDRDDTPRSAEAQILPPLRGSRAGVYDKSDAAPGARDSLKSRLSTLGEDTDEAPGPAKEAGSAANHKAHERANAASSASRWRRWFGR